MKTNKDGKTKGVGFGIRLAVLEIGVALIALISILALIFALVDINSSSLVFSLDKGATIIGLVVSAAGLVVTAYFVVLAVNAYSYVKKIYELVELSETFEEEYHKQKNILERAAKFYVNYIAEDISERIDEANAMVSPADRAAGDVDSKKREEILLARRKEYRIKRAKLSIQFPDLDDELFNKLIIELGALGGESDLDEMLKYKQNVTDSGRLALLNDVISQMERRLHSPASPSSADPATPVPTPPSTQPSQPSSRRKGFLCLRRNSKQ